MTIKYLKNYLAFHLSHIVAGTKHFEEKRAAYYTLHAAKIKHKKLAALLEKTAQEKGGVLTFPEYLAIEQFSTYGYHGRHLKYGGTDTAKRWPTSLLALCKKHNIHSLIELGPGEGALGAFTLQKAKEQNYVLSWSGIEIDESLRDDARRFFADRQLDKHIRFLLPDTKQLPPLPKSLFVFSYSLDSMPPYLFTNISKKRAYPNALIGVTIKDQQLQEVILTSSQMKQKGLSLKKGIFTDADGQQFDLTSWQLLPMQRVHILIDSYKMLHQIVTALPAGSLILIIDEFIQSLPPLTGQHLFLPQDLDVMDRDMRDTKKFYQTAGENLLYYVSFLDGYTHLLSFLGCKNIAFSHELEAAYNSAHNKPLTNTWKLPYGCYAILATVAKKKRISRKLPIFYASTTRN